MGDPRTATSHALGIPELLSEILSNLDQPSLVSTIKVNRIWHDNSVTHLHKDPDFYPSDPSPSTINGVSLFVRTLNRDPSLTRLVHRLRLEIPHAKQNPPTLQEHLVKIIGSASNLSSLSICD